MREEIKIKILQSLLDEVTKKYDYFIANRERIYKETYEMAVKDSLTGLYNRQYFEDFVVKLIKKGLRENRDFSVIFIDLDGFKPINDNYGHAKGDEVLKNVTDFFKQTFGDYDIIARLGGDEFVVVIEDLSNKDRIEEVRKVFEEVFKDFNLSFSYGVANLKEVESESLSEEEILNLMLSLADKRMYEEKIERKRQRK
ncbi:MAG: GGDEF domain-containing protein [Sulfurihydrogenibium sp.]|nr:GGDEF domain-containing protein [Sulfurihydrogenibium sp.]